MPVAKDKERGKQNMLENSRKPRKREQVVITKAIRIIKIQTVVVLLIALLMSFNQLVWGYSVLLGGCIYLIPNLYMTNRVLIKNNKTELNQSASQVLAVLYMNQIWKMVISAMLFALVFVLVSPLSPFSLFGTFIAVQALGAYLQGTLKTSS